MKVGSPVLTNVEDKPKSLKLWSFDVVNLKWDDFPKQTHMSVEKEPFAVGGFRKVFCAKSEKRVCC